MTKSGSIDSSRPGHCPAKILVNCAYCFCITWDPDSGSFRAARLPGQVGLWMEKNQAPPPNRRALDCLTIRELCPIVLQTI